MSGSPSNLRQRGLNRAVTLPESPPTAQLPPQRRNSTFSDSVSEARNTIRSSTADIFFPRAAEIRDDDSLDHDTFWRSAPLVFALFPAVAGVCFQNGNAFATDVILLLLATVFLSWTVLLPWEWYRSARTGRREQDTYDVEPVEVETTIPKPTQEHEAPESVLSPGSTPKQEQPSTPKPTQEQEVPETVLSPDSTSKREQSSNTNAAAIRELRIHELVALFSCFLFPFLGTWALHAIRSSLSRPSGGIINDSNLTIFLLAAEIRPFWHVLKMVQSRTLHLQRVVASTEDDEENTNRIDSNKLFDFFKRVEELEAHAAENATSRLAATEPNNEKENQGLSPQEQEYTTSLVSQAASEYRKSFQEDINTLNRAMRRYEKQSVLLATETTNRLQVVESKTRDALSLAAAAHRATADKPAGFLSTFLDRVLAAVMFPVNFSIWFVRSPVRVARQGIAICSDLIFGTKKKSASTKTRKSAVGSGTTNNGIATGRSETNGKQIAPQRRPSSQQRKTKRNTMIE